MPHAVVPKSDEILRAIGTKPSGAPPALGGTSVVSVVDADGNGIAIVQSIYAPWGAAALDPETGILLNNRMRAFSIREGSPNAVAAGKRPPHTLCLSIVLDSGRLKYLLASRGGAAQTTTIVQLLTNLLDRNMEIVEAVRAPRWTLDEAGNVILERSFASAVLAGLQAKGIVARYGSLHAQFFGSGQIVQRQDDGIAVSANDPRRDDVAAAA